MADTKITALTALGAAPDATDVFPVVDVSDTTHAATGTTKKVTMANVIDAVEANANVFTAAQAIASNTSFVGEVGGIQVRGASNANKKIAIGFDEANDYAWIQAVETGVFPRSLLLNPSGGNVLIGTATSGGKLTVNGELSLVDGMTAPSATSGWAKIYVDSSGGDLKVIFGDGHVATIVLDS